MPFTNNILAGNVTIDYARMLHLSNALASKQFSIGKLINLPWFINYPSIGGSNEPSPLLEDLVAYYNFQNTSWSSSVGSGYDLINTGSVSLGSGIIGNGARIYPDGNFLYNDNVSVGTSWTTSIWVKPISGGQSDDFPCPVSFGGIIYLVLINGDALWVYDQSTDTNYGQFQTTELNTWCHVAISNSPTGDFKFYFNGEIVAYGLGSEISWSSLKTANPSNNSTGDFAIDEMGIWNRQLSDLEVYALYNSGTAITYPFN
jgi:hypothetical protein